MRRSRFDEDFENVWRHALSSLVPGEPTSRPDSGVDLVVTSAGRSSIVVQIKHHPTGSGKSAELWRKLVGLEAKRSVIFTASARAVSRAHTRGVHEIGHILLADHSPISVDDGSRGAGGQLKGWLAGQTTAARGAVRRSGPLTVEELRDARPAVLMVGRNTGMLPVDLPPPMLGDRLHQALRPSPWSAPSTAVQRRQAAELAVARVISGLAMAARSLQGLLSAPLPTQPPGELVRTNPRVPRGPSAALCSATPGPSAGG